MKNTLWLETSFYISLISSILILCTVAMIIRVREKHSFHYAFIGAMLALLFWDIGIILEYRFFLDKISDVLFLQFIGNSFAAPLFLLSSYFFSKSDKFFRPGHLLLFLIPAVSLVFAVTNRNHHLFARSFSIYISDSVPGVIGVISILYSYTCILVGILILVYSAVRNSGLFSRQAVLILAGTGIPVIVQASTIVFHLHVTWFLSPTMFSFTMFLFWIAIVKYDFLSIVPVALKNVMNHIPDGLIIITGDYLLIETNAVFRQMFREAFTLKRKQSILPVLEKTGMTREKLLELVNRSIALRNTAAAESSVQLNEFNRCFSVEVTALFTKKRHSATMVLVRDITQQKEYIEALEHANSELSIQNNEIAELNKKLRELAETDGLTGVYNRRFFNHYYEIEKARVLNYKEYGFRNSINMNFGIALLDIDDFKLVNDTYGHLVGDSVLKQFVEVIKSVTFSRDIVCRYGGEEFTVIFTKTDKQSSVKAAEKIRKEIDEHRFHFSDGIEDGHITVSIGLAGFDDDCVSEDGDVLKMADDRLYKAKTSGKNRVVFE